MREVADLRSGPVENFPVGVEQQVEVGGERRDVPRIFAHHPVGLPSPDRAKRAAQIGERPEAEPDLQQGRKPERETEKRESNEQREHEATGIGGDLVGGSGYADDEAPILAHVDVPLDDTELAIVGSLAVAAADLSEIL